MSAVDDRRFATADGRRAVDIALIPDAATAAYALAINKSLLWGNEDDIVLGPGGGEPHITLMMGLLLDKDRSALELALAAIACRLHRIVLDTCGLRISPRPQGRPNLWLNFAINPKLMALHRELLNAFDEMLAPCALPSDLFPSRDIDPQDADFIARFRQEQSGDRYAPHVTLGRGDMVAAPPPPQITCDAYGLYWFGRPGTCRELLRRFDFCA